MYIYYYWSDSAHVHINKPNICRYCLNLGLLALTEQIHNIWPSYLSLRFVQETQKLWIWMLKDALQLITSVDRLENMVCLFLLLISSCLSVVVYFTLCKATYILDDMIFKSVTVQKAPRWFTLMIRKSTQCWILKLVLQNEFYPLLLYRSCSPSTGKAQ